jgi:uncharacterized SAM-binding protein YcdF (DUF218 family)
MRRRLEAIGARPIPRGAAALPEQAVRLHVAPHRRVRGQRPERVWRALRAVLWLTGAATLLLTVWLWRGWPFFIDGWLNASQPPLASRAIVCIAGGTSSMNLATEDGWQRVYAAVQLFADGYAPVVVFSGGGTTSMSEAEIYRDAAVWLGLPANAAVLDPLPVSTADHPITLLNVPGWRVDKDHRLLLVTSRLHSRRVLLTFRKQGFSDVRIVVAYRARNAPAALARHGRASAIEGYAPSGRRYDDPLRRLSNRAGELTVSLREVAAIGWYWWHGLV